ncbi:MAG: DMT family transporter [Bacteroidota bacterium]
MAALAAFFFATMPVAARLVYRGGAADSFSLLAVRFAGGALLLWFLRDRREPLWPAGAEIPWLALAVGGLTATSAAYFHALRTVPAATAVLLVYTYPAFTAIAARAWFREPLGLRRGAALTVTFIGCAALIGWSRAGLRGVPLAGLLIAALSGLTYAGFGLGGQQVMRARSAAWVNRWAVTGAALVFLSLRPPTTWAAGGRPLLYGGLYLAVIATYLANTLYLAAVRRVGATRAGLYSTTEPIFTAILAWLFLRERLTGGQMAGAALVLIGVLWLEGLTENRERQ